jgi:NAD dependent epimerase/dehydratase family enzyme
VAQAGTKALHILISGGTGFIGTELVRQLEASGHSVSKLVRRPTRASNEFSWNPARRELDPSAFDGIDVVINLSGVSTGRLPWTPSFEKQILQSRIDTSATIADTLSSLAIAPATFINASGVAFYGDRPG